jgi:hypothetical protein
MKPEERIELMAKAIAEVDADETDDPWEELNPLSQWAYRRMARAALDAAGIEALVRKAARVGWGMGYGSPTDNVRQRDKDSDYVVEEIMEELK